MALINNVGGGGSQGNILINIQAQDNATATLNQVEQQLNMLTQNTTNIYNNIQRVNRPMQDLSQNIGRIGGTLTVVGNMMGRFNDGIINGIERCGARVTSFCQQAINDYRELSKAQGELLGVVRNDTTINGGDYNAIGNAITSNARKSVLAGSLWSETDYTNTATELYKTGITGVADNYDTMNYLMKFKLGNSLTDEEVGQTMAILNQRANLNGENIGDPNVARKYLNQIQMSADMSPADVSDIIKGMSYGDPLAREMNMDFASEMALLAGFSSGGYTGTQGGTMLRRTLQNMSIQDLKLNSLTKTKTGGLQAVGLLDYWGAFVDDYNQYNSTNDSNWSKRFGLLENYANGSPYKDLYGVDMTENQRMAFMYQLLGTQGEALPSLLKGMGFDDATVDAYVRAGNGTGVEDKYTEKYNTLDGAMTSFENTINSMKNAIGEGFTPFLKELISQFTGFLNGGEFDVEQLRKTFGDSMDKVGDLLKSVLGEESVNNLKELGGKLFNIGVNLAKVSWEALPQIIDNIASVVDSLAEGKFFEAFQKSMKIFDGLDFGGMEDADAEKLGERISGILNFFMQVGGYGDILTVVGGALLGLSAVIRILDFFNTLNTTLGAGGAAGAGAGDVGAGAAGGAGIIGLGGLAGAIGIIGGLIGGLALLSQAIKYTYNKIYGEGEWEKKDHSGDKYWEGKSNKSCQQTIMEILYMQIENHKNKQNKKIELEQKLELHLIKW